MKLSLFIITSIFSIQLAAQSNLTEIESWAYQLQNINMTEISNSSFELIVIDYSSDGSAEGKFTSEEIRQIKNSGKTVVSYISIGEAENYRFYWNADWDADDDGNPDPGAPGWLGIENPDWEGNYKVRFWDAEWQQIIFDYIDEIISQGFNGIYCDIIDAYYYWSEERVEEPLADSLMVEFITKIRKHVAESTSDTFFIIPQNGEYLIEEMNISQNQRNKYFDSIDGIGVEDLFFIGEQDENNPFNPNQDRIRVLKEFLANNKFVLSVEYLTDQNLIDQFAQASACEGFIPYATIRELDQLNNPITSIESHEVNYTLELFQNYPNPFNPSTTIKFTIPNVVRSGASPYNTKLLVYDILGREVATLVNKKLYAGYHEVNFDAGELSSGMYFYRIDVGNEFSSIKKMILIK